MDEFGDGHESHPKESLEYERVQAAHEFPSETLWSVYISEADKYDTVLAEGWKDDMDSTLIFAGLFSAIVTAFIIETYKTLQRSTDDVTVALLAQISQQLGAISNGTSAVLPSPTPDKAPFSPPTSSIVVNVLWFLSLTCSLAVALFATLIKQWSRDYLQNTRRRATPYVRARIRSYLFEGLTHFSMRTVVDSVPALLHIALFLFFAGLYEFLRPINPIISLVTLCIIVFCGSAYVTMAIYATLYRNCPYHTPLSSLSWRILRKISLLLTSLLRLFRRPIPEKLRDMPRNPTQMMERIAMGKQSTWLEFDLTSVYQRDQGALGWTVKSLSITNHELEPFVQGIPGFLVSRDVGHGDVILWNLLEDKSLSLGRRIGGLLSSCDGGLKPLAQQRRAVSCITAIWSLTISILPTTKIWYSGFEPSTLSALEQRLGDPSSVTVDWARCALAVILCRLLQDTWSSSAGAAVYNLQQLVVDLQEMVNTAKRCAAVSSVVPTDLWDGLSTRIAQLARDIALGEVSGVHGAALFNTCGRNFVKCLLDARVLALLNIVVTLTESSVEPLALLKRPSGSQMFFAPLGPTENSEYRILRHLMRDLTVGSRHPSIQAALVRLVYNVVEDRRGGRLKVHPVMCEDLLILLRTIDDPVSKAKAEEIINQCMVVMPAVVTAAQAYDLLPYAY